MALDKYYRLSGAEISGLLDEALDRSYKRRDRGKAHPALGAVLREHRIAGGFTIAALAKESEWDGHQVSPDLISKVESGERGLGLESLALLMAVLGFPFANDYLGQYLNVMRGFDVPFRSTPLAS